MSKAEFWQRGESLDFKNTTNTVIQENTVITIKTRIGITGTYINPGEMGSLHVVGVFEIPKAENEEIELGTAVFFNGAAITATQGSNIAAGYATASAKATDTTVLVKLLG